MAQMTCRFAELDSDTQDYLREVRSREGERTPGVYIPRGNLWPLGAFLLGPVIILAGLWWAASSTKDAWAIALLLTAAFILGGWMIVYAFRRWLGKASRGFAGYFSYFDPSHVYEASGDEIKVTDISNFDSILSDHRLADGKYSHSFVVFDVRGVKARFRVNGEKLADEVVDYYGSLVWLKEHQDQHWHNLPAAERGGVAKYVSEQNSLPRDMKDINLEVTNPPVEVSRAGKAGGTWIPYLSILACTGIFYLLFWATLSPTTDLLAFEASKDSPAGIRAYLLDDRNTRYRDEAMQRLAAFYAPALQKAGVVQDPKLKQGLTELLENLKTSLSPVTSLQVSESSNLPVQSPLRATRTKEVSTSFADSLGQHLGRDLIAFVEPLPGTKPHVELSYRFESVGVNMLRVYWTLQFRSQPDMEPIIGPEVQLDRTFALEDPSLRDSIHRSVFEKLFGTPPPAIQQIPLGEGWES